MKTGSYGAQSGITLINSGGITSLGDSIYARTVGVGSKVSVLNSGDLNASQGPKTTGDGIYAQTILSDSPIDIVNQGNKTGEDDGIDARTYGANSNITVTNSGAIDPHVGVYALALGAGSRNQIVNSGSIYGHDAAILAVSYAGTKIVNTGDISAGTAFPIGVYGASTEIVNQGHITGFVVLTNSSDSFDNQAGGVFETKLISYFNGGDDLFRNEAGATVLAATDPKESEHSSFQGLERFENQGLITMQDRQVGDSFEIANTVGGRDLAFVASGKSTLGVDSFLGKPGSVSDTFTINGDVSGKTVVKVNNTNPGPGVFNKVGIPVVYVNGNVKGDEFFLKKPIDTGFFNYDLFFKPTGSGIFELKSVPGGGAPVLPHLITNVQDVFHTTSDTWFDRTADLRVLLNGGAPNAPQPGDTEGAPGISITPAVWVRGGAHWIGREGDETTKQFGRTYEYKLDGNLNVEDFQSGIDFGKRDLLSEGDILVFGLLGGWEHADVNFNALNRQFNMSGVQAGAYATFSRTGFSSIRCSRRTSSTTSKRSPDFRTPSTPPASACAPMRVIASAASVAAPLSSRLPPLGCCGATWTALRLAATRSPSTKTPTCGAGLACASARAWRFGPAPPWSRSSSAACGGICRATAKPPWSRAAAPFISRITRKMCGARCLRA
jgi:autotransporter family porin